MPYAWNDMSKKAILSRINTKTYHTIRYSDLESLIDHVYGTEQFSVVASLECGNDTDHDLGFLDGTRKNVRMVEWGEYGKKNGKEGEFDANQLDREAFEEWLESKESVLMYNVDLIVDDLIMRGILPSGNWLVRVSW